VLPAQDHGDSRVWGVGAACPRQWHQSFARRAPECEFCRILVCVEQEKNSGDKLLWGIVDSILKKRVYCPCCVEHCCLCSFHVYCNSKTDCGSVWNFSPIEFFIFNCYYTEDFAVTWAKTEDKRTWALEDVYAGERCEAMQGISLYSYPYLN
jgi:hypothetical protein